MAESGLSRLLAEPDAELIGVFRAAIKDATTENRAVNVGRLLGPLLTISKARHSLERHKNYSQWVKITNEAAIGAPSRANGVDFTFDIDSLADRVLGVLERWGKGPQLWVCLLGAIIGQPDFFSQALDRRLVIELRTNGLTEAALFGPDVPRPATAFCPGDLGFGEDLTEAARKGRWSAPPLIGMDDVLEQIVALLAGRAQTPVLVGEPGVGKSALIEGLAYSIASRNPLIPPNLYECRVVYIRADEILAGTMHQGQIEERVRQLLAAATADPNLIMFFDELHALLDTQKESTRAIVNALKPALRDGTIRCVGATTRQEYDRHLTTDQALTERLLAIEVREPTQAEAEAILQGIRPTLLGAAGRDAGLELPDVTLAAAIRLSTDFMPLDRLPRKAVNLIKLAVAHRLYRRFRDRDNRSEVTATDLALVVGRYRRLPVEHLLENNPTNRFKVVRTKLTSMVHGQDEAIDAIVRHLTVHANGWLDRDRPIAVFLFHGPTGVGKSALATALAEVVMGGTDCLTVKNLTGYDNSMSVARFQGSSAGYVGYGESRTVFTDVRTRPHSVVMFEDIQHATAIFPLVAAVLSGRADDGRGVTTDFRHAVFVLTLTTDSDIDTNKLPLPTELLERVDHFVQFRKLNEGDLLKVLIDRLTNRSRVAPSPLPAVFKSDLVHRAIVSRAASKKTGSGRAVIRELDEWLARAAVGEDLLELARRDESSSE